MKSNIFFWLIALITVRNGYMRKSDSFTWSVIGRMTRVRAGSGAL